MSLEKPSNQSIAHTRCALSCEKLFEISFLCASQVVVFSFKSQESFFPQKALMRIVIYVFWLWCILFSTGQPVIRKAEAELVNH